MNTRVFINSTCTQAGGLAMSLLPHSRVPPVLGQSFTSMARKNARLSMVCCIARSAEGRAGPRAGPPESVTRDEHNNYEAAQFDASVNHFRQPLPPEIVDRLRRIVDSVPGLGIESRVMDVGAGTGCLIPFLRERGVHHILAVDLSAKMLEALLADNGGPGSSLGNVPGLRTWQGDVQSIPPYQGPFGAAFFNAVFGNVHDQWDTLLRASLLLRPGGYIVISHPLGSPYVESLRASDPKLVPHLLPDQATLETLLRDLPLRIASFCDQPELYLALLKVPEAYVMAQGPVRLRGLVTTGFGRGSRQMGVPTANLPPEPLAEALRDLPLGVYFGWARLDPGPGAPEADSAVHKMVLNIGRRPTVDDGAGMSVEAHILHTFAADFYGHDLRLLVSGFLRPEMRFDGLPALIARIKTDVGLARGQLDLAPHVGLQNDTFFAP